MTTATEYSAAFMQDEARPVGKTLAEVLGELIQRIDAGQPIIETLPTGMLLIMIAIIFFLGCFMDQLSMMLLTAPIFFPLAQQLRFDLTWFGLIMLLALEVGYTTPPFGLLLFVMKGVAPPGTTMRDIYLSAMPFIACVLLLIVVIIFYPPIATYLPRISH